MNQKKIDAMAEAIRGNWLRSFCGKWRLVWDQEDGEPDGGWIATNGQMFMAPSAFQELNPELYDAMVAELNNEDV